MENGVSYSSLQYKSQYNYVFTAKNITTHFGIIFATNKTNNNHSWLQKKILKKHMNECAKLDIFIHLF